MAGQSRIGMAAFDVTSGAPHRVQPGYVDGSVQALAVSGSTLYAGGFFDTVGSVRRPAASLNATTGAGHVVGAEPRRPS